MTKIQNPKQKYENEKRTFLFAKAVLVIGNWNLFGPILRSGGACNLGFNHEGAIVFS